MKRPAFMISIVALLSLGLAAPVLAASPGNDLYGGRTAFASLPFSDSIDTTEATTDADDVEANVDCGAPATDASVWYEFTPSADAEILIDVQSADYSAGFIVVTGSPGGFSLVTCGPYGGSFSATSGVTYGILIFDDQWDGGGNGGNLTINVDVLPPPPVIDLTVNAAAKFNARTGAAIISGTVTCTGGGEFGKNFIDVQLTQTVGRLKISGYGGVEFACDGTTQNWSAEVIGQNGKFAGGKATVSANAFACGPSGCGDDHVDRTVTLKK
ncbi:MAG: DUF6299 family protein [Candidatus Limnocylindrales bacterium]